MAHVLWKRDQWTQTGEGTDGEPEVTRRIIGKVILNPDEPRQPIRQVGTRGYFSQSLKTVNNVGETRQVVIRLHTQQCYRFGVGTDLLHIFQYHLAAIETMSLASVLETARKRRVEIGIADGVARAGAYPGDESEAEFKAQAARRDTDDFVVELLLARRLTMAMAPDVLAMAKYPTPGRTTDWPALQRMMEYNSKVTWAGCLCPEQHIWFFYNGQFLFQVRTLRKSGLPTLTSY